VKTILSVLAAVVLSAPAAVAEDEVQRCGDLPPAVAKTHQAIRDAAAARDYAALEKLIDRSEFTYTFDDPGGDPIGYWKDVDSEGTDVRATIVAILDMSCAVVTYKDTTEYVWPAAAELRYAKLTQAEKAALERLYPGEVEAQYIEGTEIGYYVAWRVVIAEDGRWMSFVAGD
jgi:hypothetical protein